MGKLKEYYHEEICSEVENIDLDHQYQLEQELFMIEQQAEEAKFMAVFEASHTYPC